MVALETILGNPFEADLLSCSHAFDWHLHGGAGAVMMFGVLLLISDLVRSLGEDLHQSPGL